MLAALAAAGCASLHDAGWTGEGAEPFDSAKTACDAEAATRPEGAARTEAFEACMVAKGWRRP
jgi:hypothetical protein